MVITAAVGAAVAGDRKMILEGCEGIRSRVHRKGGTNPPLDYLISLIPHRQPSKEMEFLQEMMQLPDMCPSISSPLWQSLLER